MTSSLAGRTALVTGAARGIGRGIALGLAQSGARVGLLARTGHEIDDARAEVHDAGGTAVALSPDVSDPEQTRMAVEQLVDEFGHVELLVNNAAVVWPLGPTQDVDPAALAAAIAINVTSLRSTTAIAARIACAADSRACWHGKGSRSPMWRSSWGTAFRRARAITWASSRATTLTRAYQLRRRSGAPVPPWGQID